MVGMEEQCKGAMFSRQRMIVIHKNLYQLRQHVYGLYKFKGESMKGEPKTQNNIPRKGVVAIGNF